MQDSVVDVVIKRRVHRGKLNADHQRVLSGVRLAQARVENPRPRGFYIQRRSCVDTSKVGYCSLVKRRKSETEGILHTAMRCQVNTSKVGYCPLVRATRRQAPTVLELGGGHATHTIHEQNQQSFPLVVCVVCDGRQKGIDHAS